MLAFVTGGTGFVGGHLCERLRREGVAVRALARASADTGVLEACGCDIVRGDVGDGGIPPRSLEGVDVVFHLAGVTKALDRADFVKVNAAGAENMARAARAAGFRKRFVLLSSLAAAGPAIDGRPRTEADEPAPVSYYGASKLDGEAAVRQVAGAAFDVTVLRPGGIYGPREHEMLEVFRLMRRKGLALGPARDFEVQLTHVDDVVEGLWRAATQPAAANHTFFLNDPHHVRLSQIVEESARALGRPIRRIAAPMWLIHATAWQYEMVGRLMGRILSPLTRDKARELAAGPWLADSAAFAGATGWKPQWAFADGLAATMDWYRKRGLL